MARIGSTAGLFAEQGSQEDLLSGQSGLSQASVQLEALMDGAKRLFIHCILNPDSHKLPQ